MCKYNIFSDKLQFYRQKNANNDVFFPIFYLFPSKIDSNIDVSSIKSSCSTILNAMFLRYLGKYEAKCPEKTISELRLHKQKKQADSSQGGLPIYKIEISD